MGGSRNHGVSVGSAERIRLVVCVGIAGVIGEEPHRAVLMVVVNRAFWSVDRQRFVMRAEAMPVRVRIRENPRLKHLVRRKPNAWNDIRWRECRLLDLGKIIVGVAVQLNDTDLDQRIVRVRPDFCQIERIVSGLVGVCLRHNLNEHAPLRKIALLDRTEQIFLIAFARLSDEFRSFGIRVMLMTLQRLEMEFYPVALATDVQKRVGVRTIAVHMANTDRAAAIRKQNCHLVQAFRRQRPEVPHRGRRAKIGSRMPLLRMDEIREFQRIADEEDRRVVANEVPVSFPGIKLDRKAAHVAFRVGCAEFTGHGRKADQKIGLFADRIEQLRVRVLRNILRHREAAECAPAFGVDDALRNALAVLMRKLFKQLIVLQQQWTACARGKRVLVVGDGRASGRRELGRVVIVNVILEFTSRADETSE